MASNYSAAANGTTSKGAVKNVRRGSIALKILGAVLLAGGILTISVVAPVGGPALIGEIMKAYDRRKAKNRHLFQDLKILQRRDLVDFREHDDGTVTIKLTKAGKTQALTYELDTLMLDKESPWDGNWRMVMFDIPHEKRQARDALREKLRQLGFYQLQKSVFITPYPCAKEIDFVCAIFDVRRNVLIFELTGFEGAEKIRRYFDI